MSSFISTQFLVLNLDGLYLMHWAQLFCLTNSLFFDIPLLYCYTNLNSSIICCLSSGDMYLFLGVALFTFTSILSFDDFFETLIILSAILLPIKSSVASAIFWIALFDAVFIASVVDYLAISGSFWLYLLLKFFTYVISKRQKSISFYIYALFCFNWISHFYIFHLITIVEFILSSISNGWLF